jgi:uncharacterized protein
MCDATRRRRPLALLSASLHRRRHFLARTEDPAESVHAGTSADDHLPNPLSGVPLHSPYRRVSKDRPDDTLVVLTRVLLLSDTHLSAPQAPLLIERLRVHLLAADHVVHAGDLTDIGVIEALAQFAPVHAVLGNNDHGVRLPVRRTIDIDGCEIAVLHDSGPSAGRGPRLHQLFPTADVVVFGHSHAPWNEVDVRESDGHVQRHVNPGSAIQRRLQPNCTVAWLSVEHGCAATVVHVIV